MKFIEDYLGGLFNTGIYDVELCYSSPREFIRVEHLCQDKEDTVYPGALCKIVVELRFKAMTLDIPDRYGSLVLMSKENDVGGYHGLVQYKCECLSGKETNELFRYALGVNEISTN